MITLLVKHASFEYSIYISAVLCLWVFAFMLLDIKDKLRHNKSSVLAGLAKLSPSYWGMQVAHLGVLICVLGIAGTSALSLERDVAMTIGDSVEVQGYDFYLVDFEDIKGPNYDATRATIQIKKDDKLISTLYPEKRNYVVTMMPMTEVGVRVSLFNEMYVAMGDPIANAQGIIDNDTWAMRVYVKPMVRWIWFGGIMMALGALIAMVDRRYRLTKKDSATVSVTGE